MRLVLLAPLVSLGALLVGVVAASGCPPPPVPVVDAGSEPDAGVLGVAGDACFSSTSSNDCALGLECALLQDVDAGVFACAAPAAQGADCFFNHNHSEPDPPDDGCAAGLQCGGEGKCVLAGELFAPCASPVDCASLNCGSLTDGSGNVCVVNECAGGCPGGKVCKQAGACGLTCVEPSASGQPCLQPGTDVCSPVTTGCADGLECFQGDPASGVNCGVPGDEGSGCNLLTPQDGCQTGLNCNPGNNQCQAP